MSERAARRLVVLALAALTLAAGAAGFVGSEIEDAARIARAAGIQVH